MITTSTLPLPKCEREAPKHLGSATMLDVGRTPAQQEADDVEIWCFGGGVGDDGSDADGGLRTARRGRANG
jgi:hypothetical protein